MKKVLSPDMVAHTWANQTQEEARTAGRGSLFFSGSNIYSWGKHFCIARHTENKQGERAVLFTTRSYSMSTSRHINIVRHASNHLKKIYCNEPSETISFNISKFENEIKNSLAGLAKAKKPEKYIQPAEYALSKAEEYCKFFEVEVPKHFYDMVELAKGGKYADYLAVEAERIEAERKERYEKQVKEYKKKVIKWKSGKSHTLWGQRIDRDYLRINGDKIQTSQGIEFTFPVAQRLLKTIRRIIDKGGCDNNCNFKILDFDVKEITKDFIRVGCHSIEIKEINSIAKKLNW